MKLRLSGGVAWPPFLPALAASVRSFENERLSFGTDFPPLLAISRCFSGDMLPKPRFRLLSSSAMANPPRNLSMQEIIGLAKLNAGIAQEPFSLLDESPLHPASGASSLSAQKAASSREGFPGGAEGELLSTLKRDFAVVRHVKPKASRADSAELYVLATGFRGQRPETA